ncbi:MAG: hypothetical protein U9R52_00495, partial [Candidatus Omnitrophota bacterium]|nr:hypothetical protein [Candidatus Omnitrophota bacterium]
LTLTDTPTNHQLAVKLIREWDVGPKQISVEAKFLEITITGVEELGVEWLGRIYNTTDWYIGSGTADTPDSGDAPDYTGTNFFDTVDASGLGLWIFKETLDRHQLQMYVQALQRETKVNFLNAPRVTTLSGQRANIQVARVYPYTEGSERKRILAGKIEADGNWFDVYDWIEVYDIAEKTIGINLDVTPTVMEGSDIIMLEVFPEVTNVHKRVQISATASEDLGWPIVDTRATQTSVMVKSGETVIMGGLIKDDDETTERKIPFLGDMPLIGNLFKYNTTTHEKKNLIILLTATMIDAEGEPVR